MLASSLREVGYSFSLKLKQIKTDCFKPKIKIHFGNDNSPLWVSQQIQPDPVAKAQFHISCN